MSVYTCGCGLGGKECDYCKREELETEIQRLTAKCEEQWREIERLEGFHTSICLMHNDYCEIASSADMGSLMLGEIGHLCEEFDKALTGGSTDQSTSSEQTKED